MVIKIIMRNKPKEMPVRVLCYDDYNHLISASGHDALDRSVLNFIEKCKKICVKDKNNKDYFNWKED